MLDAGSPTFRDGAGIYSPNPQRASIVKDQASPSEKTASGSSRKRKLSLWKRAVDRYKRFGLFPKIAFWCVVVSPIFAGVGYKVAKPVYRNWKQANALRLGEQYAKQGDPAAAAMSFRKALRTNHRNPDAWRTVAEFLDDQGAPDAIMAWDQVVRLDENDLGARFRLIEAALRHHRKREAAEALEEIPAAAREDARYFYAKGVLAAEEGDFTRALKGFEKASAIDPNLKGLAIRHNIARLKAGDLSQRLEGIAFLEALGEEKSEEGVQGLRELFADAVQRNDAVSARVYAGRLMEHPNATLRDRMVRADFELTSGATFFPVALEQLREIGRLHPEEIPAIANYLLARGRMVEVTAWLDSLGDDGDLPPQVREARFELALAKKDWNAAFTAMEGGVGASQIPQETIDGAREAFELFDTDRSGATAAWQRAMAASEKSLPGLLALVKLSKAHGWDDAQLKVLWVFVEQRPGTKELWYELVRLETARKNLQGVYQAVGGALRADPENLALRSNFVIVSYLLGKGDPAELLEMAESAYESVPNNPFFITSYAIALMNAGEAARAAEIIEQLPARETAIPERALYRGAIYVAVDRPDDARKALMAAQPELDRMLPEEKLLHRSLLARLDGTSLSNEDVLAALKSSSASEEDKSRLAEALRAGRTQQSEDSGRLAQELRENRDAGRKDASDILEEIGAQRANRAQSAEDIQATIDELRGAQNAPKETN